MKASQFFSALFAKLLIFASISHFAFCCYPNPLNSWNLVFTAPVQISSIAYGNGTFVGIGAGLKFVSHDGSNWTLYANAPIINQGAVAYGNGRFLMFGTNIENKANYVLASTNGVTWTQIYTNSNALIAAAFGNNTWAFIANNQIVTAAVTSSNWNWSEFQPTFSPSCISYGNGTFVIGAFLPSYLGFSFYSYSIFSSSDGITWQYNSDVPATNYPSFNTTGIAYGNGVFVTVRSDPNYYSRSAVYVSSDLIEWTLATANSSLAFFRPITYGGNMFISSFGSPAYTSPDGHAWTPSLNVNCNALAYGQGTFVAVSSNNIYQSEVFATQSNSSPTRLAISAYPGMTISGNAGELYQIQYSTDLRTWQTLTNFMLPYSLYIWVDTSSTVTGQRFYRSLLSQ